ncbi:MAG: hypothetical protein H0T42_29960 [Deltaproteobacteria bacterium]|nr:hypothetical protein [Deltaproteobacteria bacterium]
MTCVVCRAAVTEPVFANAWEKTRKLSACCSAACAQTFDPDQHWIPSTRPAAIDHMEETRLSRVGGERLRKGDRPGVVVRDLLLGGVSPSAVRKLLTATKLGSESTDIADMVPIRQQGWLGRLIYGAARAAGPDERTPEHVDDARRDLDRWTAHFARP